MPGIKPNSGAMSPVLTGSMTASQVIHMAAMGGVGTTSGTGTTDRTSMPGATEPPPEKQTQIQALTQEYVTRFLETPLPKAPRFRLFKKDDDLRRLRKFWNDNLNFCESYEGRITDTNILYEAVEAATKFSDTFDAGLCMGYLYPEYEFDLGSKEFRGGFLKAQLHQLKMRPAWERLVKLGSFVTAGATGVALIKEEAAVDMAHPLIRMAPYATGIAIASIIYGTLTMIKSELPMGDEVPSEQLITSGPYRLHRNPFHASMGFGIGLATTFQIIANVLSNSPNYLAAAMLGGAVALFGWATHRNVRRDEAVLEKAFGEEYLEYRANTPRYFPAFWKLFNRET